MSISDLTYHVLHPIAIIAVPIALLVALFLLVIWAMERDVTRHTRDKDSLTTNIHRGRM